MATAERNRVVVAARLRRPGTGTFERPPGKIFASVRRRQYSGLQSHDLGAILSRPAAANETRFRETSCHHDAEKFAPRRIRIFARGRIYQRPVRGNFRITGSWTGEQNKARHSVLGQSLLRSFE